MKTIDLLAKNCEPAPATADVNPDLTKNVTDALINRIADAVIAKLSTTQNEPQPSGSDPGQVVTETDEGGELEDGHNEPDEVGE